MANQSSSIKTPAEVRAKSTSTPPSENKAFYPALNGLRGIAVISVFLFHYGNHRFFWWGWAGVDLFFVISGFLITGILYDTLNKPRYFKTFYIRRVLRIFPLYYTVWLVILLLTPFLHIIWNRWLIVWPLYVGNLAKISSVLHGHPTISVTAIVNGHIRPIIVVGHFWSLCVEEQFYLVWPLVVFLARKRQRLMRICVIGFAGALLLRCLLWLVFPPVLRETDALYSLTFGRVDSLLTGAWLALWLRGPNNVIETARTKFRAVGITSFILLLSSVLLIFRHHGLPITDNNYIQTYCLSLIALVGAWILIAALDPSSISYRLLLWRPLARVGEISYGIYVIHMLPYLLINRPDSRILSPTLHHLRLLFYFGIVYLLAEISFRYLESPFLRLKSRLAPS